MSSKHTQGAWKAEALPGGVYKVVAVERTPGLPIVTNVAMCTGPDAVANSRLMAAAQELLEVVKKLESFYGKLWDSADVKGAGLLSPESVAQYDELHAEAARAIAKATGAA